MALFDNSKKCFELKINTNTADSFSTLNLHGISRYWPPLRAPPSSTIHKFSMSTVELVDEKVAHLKESASTLESKLWGLLKGDGGCWIQTRIILFWKGGHKVTPALRIEFWARYNQGQISSLHLVWEGHWAYPMLYNWKLHTRFECVKEKWLAFQDEAVHAYIPGHLIREKILCCHNLVRAQQIGREVEGMMVEEELDVMVQWWTACSPPPSLTPSMHIWQLKKEQLLTLKILIFTSCRQ